MRATIVMFVAASLSCATAQPKNRGGVVMKIDGTEAHIRMTDNAVSVGDSGAPAAGRSRVATTSRQGRQR